MKVVCISIGHSSKDEGACSADGSVKEYSYNKELAEFIKEELAKSNVEGVITNRLTNGGGTGMTADIKAVNSFKSECIIELHANAFNNKATGTETLYWHTSTKGKKLANAIQCEMTKALGLADRGVKGITGSDRGGAVLRGSYYPMVITEPFFIDNDSDLEKATTHKKELAKAIAAGILAYLS
jgi:N-acetylmuramoyl-L-alanine amidase